MARISTVGHSNRTLDELVGILAANTVELVVDVRRFPASRFNPQFDKTTLPQALEPHGIGYAHEVALGGMRESEGLETGLNDAWAEPFFRNYADYALSEPFQIALAALGERARDRHCAIMCAERDWRRCHRQIIADYLLQRGFEVWHVIDCDHSQPAELGSDAVLQVDRSIHYPARQRRLDI